MNYKRRIGVAVLNVKTKCNLMKSQWQKSQASGVAVAEGATASEAEAMPFG